MPIRKVFVAYTESRTFLVEQIFLKSVAKQIQDLPLAPTNGSSGSSGPGASLRLKLPPPKLQAKVNRPLRLASRDVTPPSGLVLDYNTILTDLVTNYTFQGDTTYYISDELDCYGTNTIEGGAVIKCGNGANSVVVYDILVCKTAPYRPAIFTCTNDDTVGEVIAGSSGTPTNVTITTDLNLPNGGGAISNLFFRYTWSAFVSDAPDVQIWDCQFIKCSHAISVTYSATNLASHNVLITMDHTINNSTNFCGCASGAYSIYSTAIHVSGEHVTADLDLQDFIIYFVYSTSYTNTTFFNFTNCIIFTPNLNPQYQYGSPPTMTVGTNTTVYASSAPGGFFQTVGAASHYLADGSPYRDAGNTNININLIAGLKQKTTYPPVVIDVPGAYSKTSLNLFPQAQRDNGSNPDLGYHYDPIDYAINEIYLTNATITMNPGTVITEFSTNGYPGAITIANGAQFISQGTPTSLCRLVEYNTVQEQSSTNWSGAASYFLSVSPVSDSPASIINCRFTDFSIMAQDILSVYGNDFGNSQVPNFQDCQFHGGTLQSRISANLTNCLLERVNFTLKGSSSNLRNCLLWRGSLALLSPQSGSVMQDNMFDLVLISGGSGYTYGYNGFIYTNASVNLLSLTNSTDVFTNAFNYETGWLGRFYQTNTSTFINKGNTTANFVGLYHYTTQTNQVKETNSTVDIGFHYVAVNGSGKPDDTDVDGVPDYVEDANGNGTVQSGETDWTDPNDLGLQVIITRPKNNSIIP